jgi:hypothetical protein
MRWCDTSVGLVYNICTPATNYKLQTSVWSGIISVHLVQTTTNQCLSSIISVCLVQTTNQCTSGIHFWKYQLVPRYWVLFLKLFLPASLVLVLGPRLIFGWYYEAGLGFKGFETGSLEFGIWVQD